MCLDLNIQQSHISWIFNIIAQLFFLSSKMSKKKFSYWVACLWKAPKKSLFSVLTNSLRKMTSQPWAKDKITPVSTEIIHGAYQSLKRDPPRPFSWGTATVSPDVWCWPAKSILNVSKSQKKMRNSDAAAAEGERRTDLSFFMPLKSRR